MRTAVFILLLLLAFSEAHATKILGLVKHKSNQICLHIAETNKTYKLMAQTAEVQKSLDKLKDGDLISGQGQLKLVNNTIALNSINYVGLKKILGLWISKDQFNYDFKDYENLSLSAPILSQANDITYRVTPGDNDNWSIIFLNSNSVKVGKISFISQAPPAESELQIFLYDAASGGVTQEIYLNRKN